MLQLRYFYFRIVSLLCTTCYYTFRTLEILENLFLVSYTLYLYYSEPFLQLVCDYDVLQCKHVHVLNPHSLICYACP